MDGYWCCWHGGKGYSGVGLHVRKATFPERPDFSHPPFDFETRVVVATLPGLVVASLYVPNGGKDFPAKMRFLEALDDYARAAQASGREIVLCGDLNVTRTDRDVHPEGTQAEHDRPASRGAGAAGADHLARPGGPRARARPRQRRAVHLVAALAQHAPAEHRLAPRLRPREPRRSRPGPRRCPAYREVGTSDHGPVVAEFA